LGLTVIGASAMFTVFTYIVPILTTQAGASAPVVTVLLVLYGVGLTIGNWAGGRFGDRSVDGTLVAALLGMMVLLASLSIGMRWVAPAAVLIFLWGVTSFAVMSPLQMRVMEKAPAAPNLTSALNIGAFNLGNALGAAIGGGVISAGLGYPAVSIAGAGMAGAGLVMLLVLRQRAHADYGRRMILCAPDQTVQAHAMLKMLSGVEPSRRWAERAAVMLASRRKPISSNEALCLYCSVI